MKKLLLVILSLGFLFATSIKAETVLYCQSELATGLLKENGTWKNSGFKLKRFTIKFDDYFSRVEGMSFEPMDCKAPYANDVIFCVQSKYNHSTLRYNKVTKRFVHYFNPSSGYVDLSTDISDNDVMYAGTCQKF